MFPDRISRVNSLMQSEISIILEDYQEHWSSLGSDFLFTITRVEVERNLERATVFYSVTTKQEEAAQLLTQIAPSVLHELTKRVKLKRFPKISFQYDPNLEAGDRVFKLLKQIDSEGKGKPKKK